MFMDILKKMTDWKKNLSDVAALVRQQQQRKKTVKNRHDLEENFRGRKGFSDNGIALTEKTIRSQRKNKASYSRKNYAFSRLRFINDARAEAARQKRLEHPGYEKKLNSALDQVDKDVAAAAKERNLKLQWQDYKARPSHQKSVYLFKGYGYSDPPPEEEKEQVVYVAPDEKKEPEYMPTVSQDINGNLKFKNKVDEEIYRLKNK